MSGLPPEQVSPEYLNKPQLESWQRDILDAFYTLTRARQSGFDANPVSLTDMATLIALNPIVGFYEPMDLIDIWQDLDNHMLQYWKTKREANEKLKQQLQEKSGKN